MTLPVSTSGGNQFGLSGLGERYCAAVGFDRHDRVPGLQQRVNQAAVGALHPDRHAAGLTDTSQPAHQSGQAVGRVFHREGCDPPAVGVVDTDHVDFGGPVDPDEELGPSSRTYGRPTVRGPTRPPLTTVDDLPSVSTLAARDYEPPQTTA
jgi:hypothetical protein